MFEALFGLIHLIFVIWAFINIFGSRVPMLTKVLWAAAVFFFPLVGLVVWFFIGPKKG